MKKNSMIQYFQWVSTLWLQSHSTYQHIKVFKNPWPEETCSYRPFTTIIISPGSLSPTAFLHLANFSLSFKLRRCLLQEGPWDEMLISTLCFHISLHASIQNIHANGTQTAVRLLHPVVRPLRAKTLTYLPKSSTLPGMWQWINKPYWVNEC